ncbi:hypothetical protein NDR89_19765 [Cupriavidus gilardii]|uniref:Uncharacterized protein n=1 Tax=Cupriavidus gilardii TaxID=82541 RepID=A0ABY4VSW4_9BURK|nr:hypothetical protein [Cupriavidus gilardii]USE78876.1 hypothetical protein NDR89_19765 [Cupriavidus gilardii]
MSKYAKLDALILNKIGGHPVPFGMIVVRGVGLECDRIAREEGRDAYRVLDGRLQALRRAGKIRYVNKGDIGAGNGWVRAELGRTKP